MELTVSASLLLPSRLRLREGSTRLLASVVKGTYATGIGYRTRRFLAASRSAALKRRRIVKALLAALGRIGGGVALLALSMAMLVAMVAAVVVPSVTVAGHVASDAEQRVAELPPLPDVLALPALRSVVLAADGSPLALWHAGENRTLTSLDEVSPHIIAAVLATEDASFYEHDGVQWKAVLRALVANVRDGRVSQGGSSITQQLAKLVVLPYARRVEVSFDRKLEELRYALEIEKRLSKDEILESYLNEAYFGRGVYGVRTAAEYYFSTPVGDLDPAQAATLAGMLRSPEGNNPVLAPAAAFGRRNVVLRQMAGLGHLDDSELERWLDSPLVLNLSRVGESPHPHFSEWVKQTLLDDPRLGETRTERFWTLFTGGLTITTTLDPAKQAAAEAALAERLTDPTADPSAAVLTLDVDSGAVVAMAVGPRPFGECGPVLPEDCELSKVNPTVPGGGGSGRQTGSAFKPIVAAAALDRGVVSSVELSTRSGSSIPGCLNNLRPWYVQNYTHRATPPMDLYEAGRVSNNVFFAKLTGIVGPEAVVDTARSLGVASPLPTGCAIALGAADLYPVELASAYATLASGGRFCPPFGVSSVVDRDGRELIGAPPGCVQRIDAGVAARVVDVLRGVVSGGTGRAAAVDGVELAGKTGTTSSWRDAWFVGFTAPHDAQGTGSLVTAVWIGFDQPRPLLGVLGVSRVTGGSVPAQIFSTYMGEIVEPGGPTVWPVPPPEQVVVPDISGLTPAEAELVLAEAGLRLELVPVPQDALEPGVVLDASPSAGSLAPYRSAVELEVTAGPDLPEGHCSWDGAWVCVARDS